MYSSSNDGEHQQLPPTFPTMSVDSVLFGLALCRRYNSSQWLSKDISMLLLLIAKKTKDEGSITSMSCYSSSSDFLSQ